MSQSNMDPFDEFEFKPLTEGLGFHKKAYNLKNGLKETGVLNDELQSVPASIPKSIVDDAPIAPVKKHSFEDVLSALEKTPLSRNSDLKFTETLPRAATEVEVPRSRIESPFPRPEAYKSPAIKKTPPAPEVQTGTRRGAADSPKSKLIPATMSLESALLDLVIVMALSLIFMVVLLMITKVDLEIVFRNLTTDIMTQVSLGVLFLAVMQMYVVISRSFFGRTLGEWTFDLQIGQDEEQKKETYPLKVAARSLLVTVTGIVLLPLISAIIGRDIAGQITGVKLYQQRV